MIKRLMLDTGPLGRICNPNSRSPVSKEVTQWVIAQLQAGAEVCIPEIADYEVRRELILTGATSRITRLDSLQASLTYVALDTPTLRRAAEMWAEARRRGLPTADPKELDADVLLAAQAQHAGAIIVTENVGHLGRFADAHNWRDIP